MLLLSWYLLRWLSERHGRKTDAWYARIESTDQVIDRARSEAEALREVLVQLDDLDAELRQARNAFGAAETDLRVRGALQNVQMRGRGVP